MLDIITFGGIYNGIIMITTPTFWQGVVFIQMLISERTNIL